MNDIVNNTINTTLRHAKRIIVAVVGFTVLLFGISMIVLPGPVLPLFGLTLVNQNP